mgnify:CR=1 FL=1|tara:strand:+ start:529 stop:1494 length:966 start_codon:yes stop_codon:yes gene_type:complete
MQNIYIFGYKGQDGTLLKLKLESSKLDIKFFLIAKDSLKIVYKNLVLKELKILNDLDYLDLIGKLIIDNRPNLIFYFAAVHLAATENEKNANISNMFFTNYALVSFVFNRCLILGYKPKFIYASSSLIFSGSDTSPQNEKTSRKPKCNYARQKVLSEELLIKLGEKYEIPVLIPIFYNHESIKRKEKFFTKKIISYCSKKSKNNDISLDQKIQLFNPDSVIDMGYAPEYIDLLLKLTFSDNTGSYIFSSGRPITVKNFVNYVLEYYGLSKDIILYSSIKPRFQIQLIGDNKKLSQAIGSVPSLNNKNLVNRLCNDYENNIS